MAFTGGGGDVIGEATVEISPEINMQELQRAVQRMAAEFQRFANNIGLQPAANQVNNLTTATKKAGQSAQEARAQFVELAIGLEVAGRSLTQFISKPLATFIKRSVTEASHLNEVINQTKVIFGDSASAVLDWAETLDESLGLSSVQALEANNNFARLFNEVGVGMEQSGEFAQALVVQIADIASFTDLPLEQVIQRVTSGLVGETEAVRRLGIILDESVIKQEAYNQGIVESGEILNTQQKFLLRLQQILVQSSEAQGDAARTADTYAGQLRQLHRNTSELQVEVGKVFLPLFTKLAEVFNSVLTTATDLAEGFQSMPAPIRALGLGLTAALVILGPLVTVAGRLIVIWRTATNVTNSLTAAQARLTAVMGANTLTARAATVAFTALNKALPLIGVGLGVFAVGSLLLKDFNGNVEETTTSLEGLADTTLRDLESFDQVFKFVPDDLIRIQNEILRLDALAGDTASGSVRELSDSLATVYTGQFQDAIKATNDLLEQGALGAVEGAIATLQLSNATGQLNPLIDEMALLLAKEIRIRQQANKEQQRSSDLINGIGIAARNAKDSQEALTKATEEHLKALKEVASEFQRRASLDQQRIRANQDVADAQKQVNDANQDLIDSQAELNDLIAQGVIDTEALARAEEDLAEARERVADANEALLEAQEKASPEDLADAADSITTAEIALARVRRENAEAVADLNKELNKNNKIQRISLNLSGLNQNQIRDALGNARASVEALRQKSEVEEEDIEVVKTAVELQEEAIERDIAEREALRDVNDAKEAHTRLTIKGTEADENVIDARERLAEAERDVTEAEEARRLAGLPDQARVEAIATAQERVADAQERQRVAVTGLRTAEAERIITLKDINIEVAFLNENEQAINRALRDRFGINASLLAQAKQMSTTSSNNVQALNAAEIAGSFNFGGGLGGVLNRTKFTGQDFLDRLTAALISSPGAPLRDILRRLGVPESLFAHFREGGVVTAPTFAHMGEGHKAEAVVPLTNARNAIAALNKGWGYMAPQLKTALAPALAPKLATRQQPGFSMTNGSYSRRATPELQTLQAILSRLPVDGIGSTTNIDAPITLAAPNDDLLARKLQRELRKLQNANRGRSDARMR